MANQIATSVIAVNDGFNTNPNLKPVDPPSAGEIVDPPAHFDRRERVHLAGAGGYQPWGGLQVSD